MLFSLHRGQEVECVPVQDASGGALGVGVGDRWPVASLEAHDGGRIDFTALDGPVVVYFYPKNGTPTCTREAAEFNRAYGRYREAGVGLVGVSVDSTTDHECFVADEGLRFPLVSDADASIARRVGVLEDFGKYGELAGRVTFLVDRDGIVRRVWRLEDADVEAHPGDALDAARELGG
jgi:thioredoxin-dependent peroxiredoxin